MRTTRLYPRTFAVLQRRGAGIILAIFCILFLLGTSLAQRAQAQTVSNFYNFCSQVSMSGNCTDGANPEAGLIQGLSGDLYGTTRIGGAGGDHGLGTVFEITTGGTPTTLYNFCTSVRFITFPGGQLVPFCTDGAEPVGDLTQDQDGNLYGTTIFDGITTQGGPGGGTVFKITPAGTLAFSYVFGSQAGDGTNPWDGLVQGSDGNFYGTTSAGGASHGGTVFKITPGGVLSTIYSFSNDSNGGAPYAGLVLASDGNFYGTTGYGGANGQGGTVFRITPSGTLTTLYSFCSQVNVSGYCTDGAYPDRRLVQASDGNFYGTTGGGGANDDGTLFKITPGGTLTTLYSFSGGADGGSPYTTLLQVIDGNLYGTTQNGGANNDGTVFRVTLSGTLTTLYSFCSQTDCADGSDPEAGLTEAADGTLFGTTFGGGTGSNSNSGFPGTIFKLTTPQLATQAIVNQVNGLMAQGVINKGQDNSLVTKLQHAIAMINAGKIKGAIGKLEGFIGEINALENSGRLTGARASALTSAANGVIAQLL